MFIPLSRAYPDATFADFFITICQQETHAPQSKREHSLVASGWAVAYTRYSLYYVADEDAAQRNIWSGDFDMP